ncbi:hypothetical protein D7J91_004599 [Escherichia coli]|nr:hypothetical protein [Escherichia coli]
MDKFEELAKKGEMLADARDKAAGAERYMLNKEIKAVRKAQLKIIAEDVISACKDKIPAMVVEEIKKQLGDKLKTNAAAHQSGVPGPEYWELDPEFNALLEERLGNALTAFQESYFNNLTEEQRRYFDGDDEFNKELDAYFVRRDS